MQFTNPSPPIATADATFTTNYSDFSGHGLTALDRSGGSNFFYYTRLGGVLSGNGGVVGPMEVPFSTITNAQLHVANYTNRITLALRMNFRADSGGGAYFQTGQPGPPGTSDRAMVDWDDSGGAMKFFWDFGCCQTNRFTATFPVGATNAWLNYFFLHEGTNSSIWVDGTNYASSVVSIPPGLLGNAANPGKYTAPATGVLRWMNGNHETNYYVKRFLLWDYALPEADIQAWNQRMTYLP